MMLAAVLCCTTMMMAEPVSPSTARQIAAKFLQGKGATLKNEAMRAPRRAMGLGTDNQEQTEACPYYVFNAKASKGFVIVSGDDCVGDNLVLGYTDQGSFDADAIPSNMQWWLDEMASQIAEMSRLGVKARALALHDDVAPLVTARWDQGKNIFDPQNPYNAFCPETDGKLCLTGCMATALSQVLYYYRWPQGEISGELPAYTMYNGRVMEALPATTFNWDDMVDDYGQPTTEVQQLAVAELMRYCGQLIQMDYTPQVSNGIEYDVDMLVNLFGYDQGVYTAISKNYTVSGWDELVYNELKEGRPVVYTGQSTGGGHAFVVNGYEVREGSGYYYVNWGWGGEANGFYKISLLNPDLSGAGGSSTKDGYSRDQQAIIGLQPAKAPISNYGRYLTAIGWDVVDEGKPHVFSALNTSYKPGIFDIALAGQNADGTVDYSLLVGKTTSELEGYSFADLYNGKRTGLAVFQLPENVAEGLAPGSHKMVFVNREVGTDAPWKPLYGPNCCVELIIDDNGQPTDTIYHPVPQLTCMSRYIKINGLKQRGLRLEVSLPITNNSTDDYIGGLECAVYPVQSNELKEIVYVARTGIMIEAGGTAEVSFSLSTPQAGNYVLVITCNGDDLKGTQLTNVKQSKGYIGHKSISVDELAFRCQSVAYNERTDVEGNPAYCLDVTMYNGTALDYDAALMARLYKRDDEGVYKYYEFPNTPSLYTQIKLNAYSQLSTFIRLPEPLEPGEYYLPLYIANDFQSFVMSDYFVFAAGIIEVNSTVGIEEVGNGQLATDNDQAPWFSLDGHKFNSRPSTKGVYIHEGKKYIIK